jgi:hypothetical protein
MGGRSVTEGDRTVGRCFLSLIYATAVVYFFYAPWNYLLLAALFCPEQKKSPGQFGLS